MSKFSLYAFLMIVGFYFFQMPKRRVYQNQAGAYF